MVERKLGLAYTPTEFGIEIAGEEAGRELSLPVGG